MNTHTREEEIEMMSHPDRWPHHFVLPLKHETRRQPGSGQPALTYPSPAPDPVIRLGTLGLVKMAEAEKVEFESLEAIYDAGWRVD